MKLFCRTSQYVQLIEQYTVYMPMEMNIMNCGVFYSKQIKWIVGSKKWMWNMIVDSQTI